MSRLRQYVLDKFSIKEIFQLNTFGEPSKIFFLSHTICLDREFWRVLLAKLALSPYGDMDGRNSNSSCEFLVMLYSIIVRNMSQYCFFKL